MESGVCGMYTGGFKKTGFVNMDGLNIGSLEYNDDL